MSKHLTFVVEQLQIIVIIWIILLCQLDYILNRACKNVYDKNKFVFLVDGDNSYQNAWRIQQTFYKPFLDMEYGITDILDSYSSPFLCSTTNEVKMFGNENSKVLIEPIVP